MPSSGEPYVTLSYGGTFTAKNVEDLIRGADAVLTEGKRAQVWREAFQSAAAFAGPHPRTGRHRRGDKIFGRMMDLESEAILKSDRELAALREAYNSPTKPNEPACTECSRLASRVEELEREVRMEWWLNHGTGCIPYGDDGEMQCCGVDFKRKPLDELRMKVFVLRQQRMDKLLAGAHAEEKE